MSIEFAIWVPFICFLLVLVTDTSFMYLGQNQMWAVARDAARRMTTVKDFGKTAAETYARDRLEKNGLKYDVTADDSEADFASVIITTPISGVVPFGLYHRALLGEDIVARVVMPRN